MPIMQLLKEMKERGYDVKDSKSKVTCRVFEDDEGTLGQARFPKTSPRTKQTNQMHQHCRSYVASRYVETCPIDAKVQIRDMFTKPLSKKPFCALRFKLMVF